MLNGILQIKGYTLVRRERMLVLWNLEDGPFPTGLMDQVAPDNLDNRGEHEVVSCLFTLTKITPEEAETEVRKLIGPLRQHHRPLQVQTAASDGRGWQAADDSR